MLELLVTMVERLGILVTIAFVLTRLQFFRGMIYQDELNGRQQVIAIIFFGFFGIIGTYSGLTLSTDSHQFNRWTSTLNSDEAIANSRVIGVVLAGLLGGYKVGLGAGLIAGIHRFTLGGFTAISCGLATIITGLLSGLFHRKGKHVKLRSAFLIGALAESIQIVGEAESGEDAIMKAIQLQPNVVFLDVEMPRMNGMGAAKAFRELKNAPLVVFATAYPQFAAEAFRYDAVDYLLKPYDQDQLHETIDRILKHLSTSKESEPEKQSGKLAVEADGEIFYLEPKEILYIVRDDKWTRLLTKESEFETKMPLKDLEHRLQNFGFFRIHKSFLVNLEYVNRLTPWFNGAYQLQIEGRKEMLSVSRNYVKALRTRLEI